MESGERRARLEALAEERDPARKRIDCSRHRRKRDRWARILASEPPGRRRRDPEQERLLLELDRARLARRGRDGSLRVSRKPLGG